VIWVTLLLLLFAIPVMAADETLFSGSFESSSFKGPDLKFSQVLGQGAIFIGGYGGKIINRTTFYGSGGYLLASRIEAPDQPGGDTLYIFFAYYGFVFEYIFEPSKLLHFNGNVLIGPGYVRYTTSNFDFTKSDIWSYCLVVEPGVTAIINVTDRFRAGLGLSYRMVSGVSAGSLTNNDLGGLSVNLSVKFGEF
jgi:hypothetical protein